MAMVDTDGSCLYRWTQVGWLKPRPHQQQYRSNIIECYKSNDSLDKVEKSNVASTESNVASTLLLVWTGL